MPVIDYRTFAGEIPKTEPHLLPNASAQLSVYCDFVSGALRPLNTGLLLQTMLSNPVRGLYTDDGLLFYTWPLETETFNSPVIDDAFARMYFLTPSVGQFNVTTKVAMATNGPTPAGGVTYRAGVPIPTVQPTLVIQDRTTLPDYPSVSLAATAWWDYNGTAYSSGSVTLSAVTAFKRYTFTAPSKPGSPPDGVTPTLMLRFNIQDSSNGNAVIATITVRAGSTARSDALPGGFEGALSVTSAGAATLDLVWGIAETRAYTYTYENTWNEEGASAPPATISVTYLQDVKVTVTAGTFTGFRPFNRYYIYRTYGSNATYVRTSITVTSLVGIDTARTPTTVGFPLLSSDWFPSPIGLQGAALTANGWFAAFKGNMLYMTEPYKPHAWPYSMPFPTNVRGIAAGQGGLVVTTADGVYLVPGQSPSQAQVSAMKLSLPQPGVAQRSMAEVEGAIAYASNDGIVLVAGSVASMDASQKLFTRKSWRANYGDVLGDASMRFAYFDGALIATSSTTAKGFFFRIDEGAGSFSRIVNAVDHTFVLPLSDTLYYSSGPNVYQFNASTPFTYDWWSRDWMYQREVSFGAGYIRCDGDTQLQVYVDGNLFHTTTVQTGFFRIPPTLGRRWSFRLGGTFAVYQLKFARSMIELGQGGGVAQPQ